MTAAAPEANVNVVTSLVAAIPALEAVPTFILYPALMLVGAVLATLFVSLFGLFAIWLERKVMAHIQCRLGPMEVGRHGWLQTLADGLKLLAKEDLIPKDADKALFILAPIISFAGAFMLYVVIPFDKNVIAADLNVGILYLAAVGSVEVVGIIMSGWSSNSKWSLFGSMRAAAQVVSYELPLGLSLIPVVMLAGSLSTRDICEAQAGWFWNWYLFANPFMPVLFLVYVVSSIAEVKRAPFDLPEAESELVSGFHTEYSGMRFSIFFLAEYAAMFGVSAIASLAFLGGYQTGIPALDSIGGFLGGLIGVTTMILKSFVFVFVQMWVRFTLPRIRLDQMFHLCYKILLPFAFVCLLGVALWQSVLPDRSLWFFPRPEAKTAIETASAAPGGGASVPGTVSR